MRSSLRWILIVPAALSAYAYVQVLTYLTGFLLNDHICCALLGSIVSAFALTWAGARTAPRRQTLVADAIVVCHWIALNALGSDAVFDLLKAPSIQDLCRFCSIAATLGAAFGVYVLSLITPRRSPEAPLPRESAETLKSLETLPIGTKAVDSQFFRATTISLEREPIST